MANVTSIERRDEHTRIEHLDDGTHRLTLQRGQCYFDRDTSRFEDTPARVTADAQVPGFSHRYKAQHWSRFGRGQWKIGFGPGRSITYLPRGATNVAPVSSGRVVTYRDLWPGVDVQLMAFPEGVKEDLVLKAPGAPASFIFDVELSGVILVQDGHSLQVLDTLTGQVVGRIPAPTVHDAAGVAGTATLTYSAGAMTIAVDSAWLIDPGRAWPVIIDPTTVTLQPDPTAGKDAWCASGSSSNLGANTVLQIGSGTTYWGLLQFALNSLPAGSAMTSATLSLFCSYVNNTNTLYSALLRAHSLDAAWDEATVSGTNSPAHGAWTGPAAVTVDNSKVNTWIDWDITALATSWLNGTRTNNGVGLYDEKTSNLLITQFPSSDYTADITKRPKLVYSYTTSTITVTSPNGTQAAPAPMTDDVTPILSGQYNNTDAVNMTTKRHQLYDSANNLIWDSGDVAQSATPGSTVTATVPAGLLQYGKTYWWRWMAKDANGGVTPWTAAAWFQPVMSAPTGLTATADAANASINLAWMAHPGEALAGYRVYRRKAGGSTWTKLNQALAATASYTDDAPVSGQSYDYAVSAVATDGYESPLSAVATGSVTYADTWIDDVKLTAVALTDQTLPFLGSAIPVHGKATPVVFGRQAARRRTLSGTADGSQAMADLERVLAAGQTHRYADPAQAFRFIVVGDLRAQRTYPVTDASGNAMEQFDWSVDVGEVA